MAKTIYVEWSETSINPVSKTLQCQLNNDGNWVFVSMLTGESGAVEYQLPSDFDKGTAAFRIETVSELFGVETVVTTNVKTIDIK